MKKYLSILLILCMCLTACATIQPDTSTSGKDRLDTTSEKTLQSGQEEKAAKAPDTSKPEGMLEVHYIDVGQGDATLIKCGSHAMLIDGGNNNKGTTVQLYLKKQGVESLDYVIGTHPDADHIGGLDVIVYKYNCDTVIMPDYEKDTRTYQELVDVIHDKNMKITYPVVGEQYALGEAKFTIIAPNSNSYGGNANDYSVAILLEYGKNRFLFTGDAHEWNRYLGRCVQSGTSRKPFGKHAGIFKCCSSKICRHKLWRGEQLWTSSCRSVKPAAEYGSRGVPYR